MTIANNTEELSNILNDPVEELENNTTLTTQDVQLFEVLNPEISLMEGIETKIQNSCDGDLETSISLAAEAGNLGVLSYQTQTEKLENERELLLHRNAKLVETINQLENQLCKEKELRTQLQTIFEEQDQEKEKAICEYVK
ncbi:hypothetical protein J6590_037104 [Homalodisca vitripennis]|nr:hypothetical protein J6590_037104 [Homalodisca vitripennis]